MRWIGRFTARHYHMSKKGTKRYSIKKQREGLSKTGYKYCAYHVDGTPAYICDTSRAKLLARLRSSAAPWSKASVGGRRKRT